MSLEYDYQAGFDLASVDTPTRVQLMQAFNQLAPLTNKGGIIYQSTAPDVVNNPRYARFIWLDSTTDPPVPKYYNVGGAAWSAVSVAAGSITNTQIAAAAGIVISKLGITGTGAGARAVARINAANTAMEYVAPASINTTNEIPVNNLVVAAGDSYLKTVGGNVVWVAQATERAAIQAAIAGLTPSQITPGANGTIMGVTGGIAQFLTPDNAFASQSISPIKLASGGATTDEILRWTGSTWSSFAPVPNVTDNAPINYGIIVQVGLGGASTYTQAHGLGVVVPKLIRAVLVCDTADNGYVAGDEVDVMALGSGACVAADTTNIVVSFASAAGNTIIPKAGGALAALTEANWSLKVYAWR